MKLKHMPFHYAFKDRPQWTGPIRVTAFDPSMNNWGAISVDVYYIIEEDGSLSTRFDQSKIAVEVIKTSSNPKDKRRQVIKNTERAQVLWEGLQQFKDSDYFFVESPHGSQSFSAALSYGMCVGLLGALSSTGIPMQHITAVHARKTVLKPETLASVSEDNPIKDVVMKTMTTYYDRFPWPTRRVDGVPQFIKSRVEHLSDGLMVLLAGLDSPEFLQYLKTRQLLGIENVNEN